jgi:hypothetical protein
MSDVSPGPYEPRDYGDRTIVVDDDSRCVCWMEQGESSGPGRTRANARLLAASWSLLKAAENLLGRFMSVDEDHSDLVYGEDLDEIRAAVAEAKGGE